MNEHNTTNINTRGWRISQLCGHQMIRRGVAGITATVLAAMVMVGLASPA